MPEAEPEAAESMPDAFSGDSAESGAAASLSLGAAGGEASAAPVADLDTGVDTGVDTGIGTGIDPASGGALSSPVVEAQQVTHVTRHVEARALYPPPPPPPRSRCNSHSPIAN